MAETAASTDYLNVSTARLCTREEAAKLVRLSERQRARWYLSVRLDTPLLEKDGTPTEHVFRDCLATYLEVSRKEALRIVGELSAIAEEKGARIRVTETLSGFPGDLRTQYWIGQ
jgi:hypothetical protein